jgi:hypothetical protein
MRVWPARRRRTMILPWDNEADPVGGPGLRLPRMTSSKNTRPDTGRSSPRARENSACRIDSS